MAKKVSVAVALIIFSALCGSGMADGPPIKINIVSDKTRYSPESPIAIQVRVFNNNWNPNGEKDEVIAGEGFFSRDYHLMLTVIDPTGKPVALKHHRIATEPPPPYNFNGKTYVPVEIVSAKAENLFFMKDARKYYDIGRKYGWYTAYLKTSLEIFSDYIMTPDGALMADLNDKNRKIFNPLSSNKIRFEIVPAKPLPERSLLIRVMIYELFGDKRMLPSDKKPENFVIRIYGESEIPAQYKPISLESYDAIWQNVPAMWTALSNARGEATFSGVREEAYLILVRHPILTAGRVLASALPADHSGWRSQRVLEKRLEVVINR
jgi:hypothetical protein